MTSRSPRKPRTTAPRTRAGTACSRIAVFLVLAGGTAAIAQYPTHTVSVSFQEKKGSEIDLAAIDKKARADYIKLPPRADVFAFPNDLELEMAILKRLREDEANRVDEKGKKSDPFLKYPPTLRFPPLPKIGEGVAYVPKTTTYPPARGYYEPLYVTHRRLHFEEVNAERYGWDFGIIQPFVSTAIFYKDVLSWPHSLASGFAHGFWDTNAGKCLPGSPTPYMLYPPGLTITGSVFEAAIITGAAFIFP